ncbi:hypothetical protein KY306_01765 [Candidatus Woesearchaeota archaeon]|nr:hypothetical protein [Candidatus Woesearchaeota archaeon]
MTDPILELFEENQDLDELIIRRGEIKYLRCQSQENYAYQIKGLIPQASEDVTREFNRQPTQEDLRKITEPKTITVHSASPLHIYSLHYFREDGLIQRTYIFLPHVTFPMTLIPLPRSYKATKPLVRGQSLSQSESSPVLRP